MDQTGGKAPRPASRYRRGVSGQGGVRPANGGRRARVRLSIAVTALTTIFTTAAHAQAPARPATSAGLQEEVMVLREQLRTMQEQQKALTDTVNRLQQQLGSQPVPTAPQPVPLRSPASSAAPSGR